MEIDKKGCALIIAVLVIVGFLLGLIGVWLFDWPKWVPIVCAIGLPTVMALLAGVTLILSTDWSH